MVKVKFCGLKRREDVEKALSLGVDYIGFVLYPKSPRFVSFDELKELVHSAGNSIKKVGVMVNPEYEEVKRALDTGIDLVQLHGEESFQLAKKIGISRVIKAFRVKDDLHIAQEWQLAYAILLDTYSEKAYGGTGKTFDWKIAEKFVKEGFRVFLSGGLNPSNVIHAVKKVNPYAVDVSSGIEVSPGVKDHKKMIAFVEALRNNLS
ncbi:phosphoribosylanthranilate isomerase [Hydrogenobacter hydrogenophilus]|uniref:N-(5'-phosphoribosyl)anthranilate isomerase n=1 Tax=Hydrogenobacter hydrogenophilus TaxID=35835 RepID=A0A285NNB3_9AQUI|nr:phosphoribosylanthranilate isomerase [Hydrogenobacter hydrogenophilus]SNZ10939.1 phosphoribosylanthranilate isomerase [Hydrogenobacter hydrogenophilus]